ncbi:MAG TPA: cupredoxin domain-containing protein [Solirubrobacteraceae bacterium]|jgi:hypothetical protein|nr:cupredoxin domain-containing protein [Solirubrobacteraceae bacterium]
MRSTGFFVTLALGLAGCMGGGPEASLTVGAEGFEPPVVTVDAGTSFDLEVVNDTKAVQTVTVEGRPGLRVLPGETSQRQIDSLDPGEYKVTLEGAPFEATVRAEE